MTMPRAARTLPQLPSDAVATLPQPQIVLLDLGMPKMDGLETARKMRLRSWGKRATLIALTGWGRQQDRKRTSEAGFDVHLVKPVNQAQLFEAIARAGKDQKRRGTDAAAAR
jgi:CheY-like chemotaxis protein